MKHLNIKKLSPEATLPTRAHSTDCGLDIYSIETVTFPPGEGNTVRTGIAGEFSPGYLGMMLDRSSMARRGFKVAGGVIDPGYTGELLVVLRNISNEPLVVHKGDRIAQLLILPIMTPEVFEVGQLKESERKEKGFGSSGR